MKSELLTKILNNEICRLCLEGKCKLLNLDESIASGPNQEPSDVGSFKSGLRPRELIERFRLIEVFIFVKPEI